jgi:hypothetical protein
MASLDSQIYISRDQIRTQIMEYIQFYLELENVDLTKSSFLSFMIDTLATLTSNLLFYQLSVHREFFMTKAQLPESILNLAAFLGYSPSAAKYATANVLLTIPLEFTDASVTFTLEENFQFKADDVQFETYYTTNVTVTNNSTASVQVNNSGRIYNLPVSIDTTSDEPEFSFVIPVRQKQVTTQETQLDANLQEYQFTDISVNFIGKFSSIEVWVKEPGSDPSDTGEQYTEFSSLYLMSSTDKGFVFRRTSTGGVLYFGNGIIGYQPTAGSTIISYITETDGVDGNVIAGSIKIGDRLYTQQGSPPVTQLVDYTVVNVSPASNGEDEESMEEIRQNSINSLTSLNRLVSEEDYLNSDVVIPDSPLGNSLPILKRSDLKVNEIQMYTTLDYGNDIVPTRNHFYPFDLSLTDSTRGTEFVIDSNSYYSMFDMTFDKINSSASYHYTIYEINTIPTLSRSWETNLYEIQINNLNVLKSASEVTFTLTYYSTETSPSPSGTVCTIIIPSTGGEYITTNTFGVDGGTFTYTFDPYTILPDGNVTYIFRLSNINGYISEYTSMVIVRQDLSSFMQSNAVIDSSTFIVYDIPVIEKEFYDAVDKPSFELQTLQTLLQSTDLIEYRMITDFVNVKFSNTHGLMRNMQLNKVTATEVLDIGLSSVPVGPNLSDRYIATGYEGGDWDGKYNMIVTCVNTAPVTWSFLTPRMDDTIHIVSKGVNYVYGYNGWIDPSYNIPLDIELEVAKDEFSGILDAELSNSIKTELLSAFTSRFGIHATIYRSEIVDTVQSISGVSHCKVIQPATSIFFNTVIDDLDQDDLLEYSPEYLYFTSSSIIIRFTEIL